jgi:uncharacterized repeat protein (TIGR02543 family)
VKEWKVNNEVVAGETGPIYTITSLDKAVDVTVEFEKTTFTVTFKDWDGRVLDTQEVEPGGSATAPNDPEREGYTFKGWDEDFTNVTGNLTVTATYTLSSIEDLNNLTLAADAMVRPAYTTGIAEWNTYWDNLQTKLQEAKDVYDQLKGKDVLTSEETTQLAKAKADLQTAMEIIEGIEDFDASLGGRESPLGLVETVYNRSLISDGFQYGRLRCFYDKEDSYLYWLLSGFLQAQGYFPGTTGTGMNPGLQNVMASASIVRLQSGDKAVEIFHSDGTRKTPKELEDEGISLAMYWLFNCGLWDTGAYVDLVGFVIDCQLVGETSGGTEFIRTYTFHFVDAGVHLFEKDVNYHVVDGAVLRDFEGYKIINVTQNLKYTEGTIQTAISAANPGDEIHVSPGIFNESLTIDKSIVLLGSHYADQYYTVLNGDGLDNKPGIQISAGVSDVTITGFEIKDFGSGGIAAQDAGINNVTITRNYIHDVDDGIYAGTGGEATLSGWSVSDNIIDASGTGIALTNIGSLTVDQNEVTASTALEVKANNRTVENAVVTNNKFFGNVNVLAQSTAGQSATLETATIKDNTINGRMDIGISADGEAKVADLTIQGNEINFSDKGINITANAPGSSGNAEVASITVKDNELVGSSTGIEVSRNGAGNVEVKNLTISGNNLTINNPAAGSHALGLADVAGTSKLENNKITLSGTAGGAYDGVRFSGSATGNWIISGNELYGDNVGSNSSGFLLESSLGSLADLQLSGNRVTGWTKGVYADALTSGITVELRRNWIYGNSSYGIENGNGATIDAIRNYWGDKSGPYHATNTGGQGNAVSDNVNFDPWHQDADFISFSDGTVTNLDQGKYYSTIQEAVYEANPGDTIQVAPGTYKESILIDRSVTLIGDPGDPETIGPGSNAPVIDCAGLEYQDGRSVQGGFYIHGTNAHDVVIEGFEIKNVTARTDGSGVFGHGEGVSNVTLRYNYIHDVAQNGVRTFNSFGRDQQTGWIVSDNIIEKCAGPSIQFVGTGESVISRNKIFNPSATNTYAILVKTEVTGNHTLTVSDVEISDNEILDWPARAIYILADTYYVQAGAAIEGLSIINNAITSSGQAISWWAYGSGVEHVIRDITIADNTLVSKETAIDVSWPTENVTITGNEIVLTNSDFDVWWPSGAAGLGDVSGTGIFSNNTVRGDGEVSAYAAIAIDGSGGAAWTIEDNVLDGNGIYNQYWTYGLLFAAPPTTTLQMNRNIVTGWTYGIRIDTNAATEATLRDNRIFGNAEYGLKSHQTPVDATLNYWGDESGPWSEEGDLGEKIVGNILFDPWYIDIECTISSDQEAMDQEHVNTALAKVPATIASVEVPGGTGASDEAKRAAVKAYLENLEGMAALGVTITIDAGSSSGYKVTITKGEATPGIRDNVEVIKFTIPPADSEAAGIVNDLITALPSAANLYLDNYLTHLAAIEEAEAAFNALTEPQKTILGWYLEEKLDELVTKVEGLVLEELDDRILSAIGELELMGTGIEEVGFVDREATLFVDDPNKKVYEFVQSGVVPLFQTMFQDVVAMRLGEDPDWYGVEGTSAGAMEAGAHIVSVLLGFPYEYGEDFGGVFSQLAAADLGDLLDKSLSIEVKIQRLEDGKEYLGTYIIGFSPANEEVAKAVAKTEEETFTLTFDGNGGTPELIEVQVETEVMLEALPAVSREGYTFIEWNTCADGSGEAFDLKTAITEDMTLYAVWKEAETEKPGLEEPIEEPEGESEEPEDEESPVELEEPEEEIEDEEDDNETGDPDEPEGGETPAEPEDPADEPEETPTGPEEDDDDDYEETDPDAIVDEEEDAEDDEERDGNTESGEGNSGEEQNADGENGVEEDGVA